MDDTTSEVSSVRMGHQQPPLQDPVLSQIPGQRSRKQNWHFLGGRDRDTRHSASLFLRCRLWYREGVSCLLVIGALAGLVLTLIVCDRKPLPDIPFGLSINTMVSIYTVVIGTAATAVLADGLSAAKWSWLRQPQRLYDMTIYDDASRGWWGALKLLYRLRCTSLVPSLGAMLTLVALVLDPVTQQLLGFYDCSVALHLVEAHIARTNVYEERGTHVGAGLTTIPFELLTAVSVGLSAPGQLQAPWACSSGNCTFDEPYSSVGFCSNCIDATEELVIENPRTEKVKVTLASAGLELDGLQGRLVAGGTSISTGGFSVIFFDGHNNATAYTCTIDPCVHSFRGRLEAGRLQEKIISRSPAINNLAMADLSCLDQPAAQIPRLRRLGYRFADSDRWLPINSTIENGTLGSSPVTHIGTGEETSIVPAHCIYQINPITLNSVNYFVGPAFFEGFVNASSSTGGLSGPPSLQVLQGANLPPNGSETYLLPSLAYLQSVMQNVTDSMTTYVRSHGNENYSQPAVGQVHHYATCVKVRWPYVAYASSVVVLLLVFFISTVISTIPDNDFKSSSLATLFHGFEGETRQYIDSTTIGQENRIEELERFAKKLEVRLLETDVGLRICAANVVGEEGALGAM